MQSRDHPTQGSTRRKGSWRNWLKCVMGFLRGAPHGNGMRINRIGCYHEVYICQVVSAVADVLCCSGAFLSHLSSISSRAFDPLPSLLGFKTMQEKTCWWESRSVGGGVAAAVLRPRHRWAPGEKQNYSGVSQQELPQLKLLFMVLEAFLLWESIRSLCKPLQAFVTQKTCCQVWPATVQMSSFPIFSTLPASSFPFPLSSYVKMSLDNPHLVICSSLWPLLCHWASCCILMWGF